VLSIVRHARTEANAGGRLQGRLDLPLDEVGVQQAAALTGFVTGIDRVVCSPLLRARQTAEAFGMEPTIDDRWQEVSYGSFEGMKIADVPGDTWHRWITDIDFAPDGAESLRAMSERVHAALDDLAEEAMDQHIVVVTHATPVKAAMAWALGVDVGIAWRSWVDQASVTRITMRDRGPALAFFNRVPEA
jgi:broad specificity phosphatase PhoE